MSPRNVQARFVASDETGDVRSVEVYGHVLTEKFARVDVDADVLAKLQGNPHIEVKGDNAFDHDGDGKPGGSRRKVKDADPVNPEAEPEAETVVETEA